jgi:hypothetical protein
VVFNALKPDLWLSRAGRPTFFYDSSMINSSETVKKSAATACGGLNLSIYIELTVKNWYNPPRVVFDLNAVYVVFL